MGFDTKHSVLAEFFVVSQMVSRAGNSSGFAYLIDSDTNANITTSTTMNKENIHTATDTSNVGVAAVSDEGVLDACLKFEEVPIFDVTTFKPSENLTGLLNKIVASKPQEIDVGFSDNVRLEDRLTLGVH